MGSQVQNLGKDQKKKRRNGNHHEMKLYKNAMKGKGEPRDDWEMEVEWREFREENIVVYDIKGKMRCLQPIGTSSDIGVKTTNEELN